MLDALKNAYLWHRQRNAKRHANDALAMARNDVANGIARYPTSGNGRAVHWQPIDESLPTPCRTRDRLAYVDKPDNAGLRFVGKVTAECGYRNGMWTERDSTGWFTDPYGESFRDGTGLCWGEVWQLPGRHGKARFVAGYRFGGSDSGPTIDFGHVFESEPKPGYGGNPQDYDDARDAARTADSMAQEAAEKERDYQAAWQAGSQWADKGETIAALRQRVRALTAARKAAPRPDKKPISAAIESIRADISELIVQRKRLASGDGSDALGFYTGNATLRAAFCEGGNVKKFPEV